MFHTKDGDINISGYLAGMRQVKKIKGKRVSMHLEHKTAFFVIVEDKAGKVIIKDGFRYIQTARDRFASMVEAIA